MPPLLCPSPQILDQAFPRSQDELLIISIALGEIEKLISEQSAGVVLTEVFEQIISDDFIDWQNQPYPLIIDVQRLFSQLFLQSHQLLMRLDVSAVLHDDYERHPVPKKCVGNYIDILSDELGKILVQHDKCIEKDEFFIGIACPYGFSGGEVDSYNLEDENQRVFPLVGLETFESELVDAFEWYIPTKIDIKNKNVDRKLLERNYSVVGISRIDSVRGRGSHQLLVIEGHRDIAWAKNKSEGDKNVQLYILDELSETLNYPLDVIKYALLEGKLPDRRFKLDKLK